MPTAAAEKALAKLREDMAKELEPNEIEELVAIARKRVKRIEEKSTVFDEGAEKNILRFDYEELQIGKHLGTGGFAKVSSIAAINIPTKEMKPPMHSREYMAMQCIREVGGPRYAIKQLSAETKSERHRFEKGMSDIVIEARILAVIQHENIIRIRGFANCDYFDKDFFILMDRLHITLDKQIIRWSQNKKSCTSICCLSEKAKVDVETLLDDQLSAALSIASAIEFLHTRNIIYRDLKPENIGFDVRENIKLFDFGLVAEVVPSKANEDGTFKLTGFTGSPVYMAPEVANNLPYNFKADSYSFGILFWHIMSMKKPYEKLTFNALQEFVMNGTYRPTLEEDWTDSSKKLMEDCWNADHKARPGFEDIVIRLQNEGFGPSNGNVLDASTKSYSKIMASFKQSLQ